jgi:radical SAM superfamily enzyme YgiQ (UPF0313 family)
MNHCLLFNVLDPEKHRSGRTAGVYRIAHFLRKEGWDVEVIDYAMSWSLKELQELCKSRVTSNTKFFGFSHLFSIWSDTLEDFIKWSRKQYPSLKYISGSAVNPFFKSNQIDYYIQGYGENATLTLLNYLFSNGERPKFWLNTGRKIINAIADYPAYPMRDLSVEYEERDFIQPWEWLSVEFSRGCMFSCDFCNFPLIGLKGDMTRDADNFDLEMKKNYDRWGVQNYIVTDETFNDRTEKIKKFADVVEKLNFQTFFSGFVRADLMISRKGEIEDLARMNLRGHYYGIESFNHRTAKSVGKGMHPDRVKQGLIDIRKYFESTGLYRGTISIIVGLPHEDVNSLKQTRQWLLDNWKSQSLLAWALSIPENEIDIQSKFSDYTKYGYSKMTEEEILNTNFDDSRKNLNDVHKDSLRWKNEYMNYVQAKNTVNELFNNNEFDLLMDNKFDNFELANIMHGSKTLKQRFEGKTSRLADSATTYMASVVRDSKIDAYKERKLSI